MSTGSIKHNIEITNPADAERFVEALEKAKAESEEGMEISELLEIAKKGNLTDCGQRKCADIIEALQQEIQQHIKWNEAHTKARVEQAELIDKLVADKDEQAGRIMQFEKLAKDLYFAYINKDPDCPHDFEIKAIERYQALLGGKEDA